MVLTEIQRQALAKGEPISVTIDNQECVVVQQQVFNQLKDAAVKDAELTPRDTYATVLQAIDKDDVNPDQYLEYLQD